MKKFLNIIGLLVLCLGIATVGLAATGEVHLEENLPNDGVLTIPAGDLGWYKIDTRFNLCFLVSKTVVQIDCSPFDNLHGNED